MATRPFPISAQLTAIALAYRNPDVSLIADDVLPRTPTAQEFKYLSYDLAQGYTVPNTLIGRKSAPNQVDFQAVELSGKCDDYGLSDLIPNEDIRADNQGVDPLGTSTAYLTNLINLAREQRVANMVFNGGSFAAGNQATLSGTSQWSDTANSDPVAAIGDALDIPVMRPNIAVFGQSTWTKLRRHPKIVQAVKGTAQGAGMVSRQEFADLFELQSVFDGAGFANAAKRGQAVNMQRLWGISAAFIYRDRAAGPQAGVTFGFSADWGGRYVPPPVEDPKVGAYGAKFVKVIESVKELVVAKDIGYYFANAVA